MNKTEKKPLHGQHMLTWESQYFVSIFFTSKRISIFSSQKNQEFHEKFSKEENFLVFKNFEKEGNF